MSKTIFDCLQELEPELVKIANSIEDIFFDDPHGVLVKARLFTEKMTKKVAEFENLPHLLSSRQVDRVQYLDQERILTKEIARAFDTIRTIGNKASHESLQADFELAFKVHKNLYKISAWFLELYGPHDIEIPEYQSPIPKRDEGINKEEINKMLESIVSKQFTAVSQQLAALIQEKRDQIEPTDEASGPSSTGEKADDKTDVNGFEGKQLHGSYLLYELSKLKESSQEAVEGSDSFSQFKKYLHVERLIQRDLMTALEDAKESSTSQLILLCGSVGDGKSHLLAYMNEEHPELMEGYQIHNDATESFDPYKNSLDTLAEVLKGFSDDHIEHSNEKLILAINLGVLHNFLESDYAKKHFTKLSSFIEKSRIFESDYLSENIQDTHFKLISFSDYHPYELTKDGPKSDYFVQLLEKIVQDDPGNPFHTAYEKDMENGLNTPFMYNYRLLKRETVRKLVSHLLIKASVQYKQIISTRAFLNFIHDIIVPSNIETNSIIEELEAFLPNLIFDSPDRSPLLSVLSKLDPVHFRSKKIDEVLMQLNNTNNIVDVFQEHLELDEQEEWIEQLSDLGAFYELTNSSKQVLNSTLIRFAYFLGKNFQDDFRQQTYEKYMDYLYKYNVGDVKGLRPLFKEVKEAVFNWKGKPKKNKEYIFLEETSKDMNIAQSLNIRPYVNHLNTQESDILYRFKNVIKIGFQDENKTEQAFLEIDFPLYQKILKVLNGYRPNKKDKEDAIQFIEFIDKLLKLSKKEDELMIYDHTEDLLFKLEYDEDFNEFTFKRE